MKRRKDWSSLIGKKVVAVQWEDYEQEQVVIVFDDDSTVVLGSTSQGYCPVGLKFSPAGVEGYRYGVGGRRARAT